MRYAVALVAILALLGGSFPAAADDVIAPQIAEDSANVVTALPFLNKGEDVASSPRGWVAGLPASISQDNVSSYPGTCKTVCSGLITVTWSASSYDECCQGSANVCPQGSTPLRASYTPNHGYTVKCESLG